MSLAEQRSNQRMVEELLEELRLGSPRGSPTLPSSTSSVTKHRHLERLQRSNTGHRRIHSSPEESVSSKGNVRARTLSGGTFGKMSKGDRLDVKSIIKSTKDRKIESETAPVSPMMSQERLNLTIAGAKSSKENNATFGEKATLASVSVSSHLPVLPLPHPTEKCIAGPSMQYEPPIWPSPVPQPSNFPHLPSSVPSTTFPPGAPDKTRSSVMEFDIENLEEMQPAAVVVDSENANSPAKQRSDNLRKNEKGKQRQVGERSSEGRQQTVRRAFIGPGGIMHRIASSHSLGKVREALPFTKQSQADASVPALTSPSQTPQDSPIKTPHAAQPLITTSPTPTKKTFLRPAPPPPSQNGNLHPIFAPSSAHSLSPSPSHQRHLVPSAEFAPSAHTRPRSTQPSQFPTRVSRVSGNLTAMGLPEGFEMIEIPRFKKRELNLGLVRKHYFWQRIAWLTLGTLWLANGLLSLFFDVNVLYILIQCTIHPSYNTNSDKTWTFAAAAYGVLWGLSTLVVWLGWELGYEFWRRWRLDRPAIEPIYFSLPASLHLSLVSYNHFIFLLHIRTSPLSTPHARDIIPETCHFFIQLLPGLIPFLPRAAIAVVILISFWKPAMNVQAPFGGTVDQTSARDTNFFKSDAPGELTQYAKGVLFAFTVYTTLRLLVVIASAIGLWAFSSRPLGGLIGRRLKTLVSKTPSQQPSTPKRRSKGSYQPRDPNLTHSPQKNWIEEENGFDWAWRERTRARIQDAFELCIIRFAGSTSNIFASPARPITTDEEHKEGSAEEGKSDFRGDQDVPWGRSVSCGLNDTQRNFDMEKPSREQDYSAEECITENTGDATLKPFLTGPPFRYTEAPRTKSILDPASGKIRPIPSKAETAATQSTNDLFYTPIAGNTPMVEKSCSMAEGINMMPSVTKSRVPPSSFKPQAVVSEFGVKQNRDSPVDSGEGDDESTGLLSSSTSPRHSSYSRDRSSSNASRLSNKIPGGFSHRMHPGTHSHASSTSSTRRRAHTNAHPPSLDLSRARSSSITLLKESLSNGALIRRARSGTLTSIASGEKRYKKVDGEDSDEELDNAKSPVTSRSMTDKTMGFPFATAPTTSTLVKA
ncbi:hypothetical protein L204_104417 [Cryptococcus depauperatus]|nr:hypothetical protein L204_06408 [Cryptococcus depauperatus CBS 7855]